MRSTLKVIILAPAIVLAAACSKDKAADPALNNDLSLAAQANPNARLDSISAAERTNAAAAPATGLRSSAPAAAPARPRATNTSSSTRRTGSSSSAGSTGSSAASQPATVTEKHTKRDAAIGAAAGAIIGATTSQRQGEGRYHRRGGGRHPGRRDRQQRRQERRRRLRKRREPRCASHHRVSRGARSDFPRGVRPICRRPRGRPSSIISSIGSRALSAR